MSLSTMIPVAPPVTSMPFWAMSGVSPMPVTVLPMTLAVRPAPRRVMPLFW
jgi:hypothetical protein